jgi:hypothetical protein
MPVYVDELMDFGWKLRGRPVQNCHLFTDELDLTALHAVAQAIGMKRSWFQDKPAAPHYDLTPSRRAAAIENGAIPLSRADSVAVWKARRAVVASATNAAPAPKGEQHG